MKIYPYILVSITCMLLLAGQSATAQDNSVENFAIAALKVEKAHVIEGIYYLTQVFPRQCHDPNVGKAAAEFSSNNRELIERVNASPLFPMVRDGIEKANATPKPLTQVESECVQAFAALKSFDSEPGRKNAAQMLQTMKKEIIVKTD